MYFKQCVKKQTKYLYYLITCIKKKAYTSNYKWLSYYYFLFYKAGLPDTFINSLEKVRTDSYMCL